ncbi:phosphatase PAP2 family protein [Streptomyces halstedii]|uniref:phosphatase PAP2 family protein n=1 Tax=Streptomyces halstedii TaxID=1944 RepID=UPI00368D9B0A
MSPADPPAPAGAAVRRARRRAVWWCVLAAVAFAGVSGAVLAAGGGQIVPDSAARRWALDNRPSQLVTLLRAVTATGTGVIPYVVALGAGLIAAPALQRVRRRPPVVRCALPALAFAAWLALGQALRFGLMTAIARPRPPAQDWLTHASRWSFPSGHTTTSAMAAGLLVLALLARRPAAYRLWVGLTVVWAAVVGISRVWLGVHWATDVLAGWLLAAAWTLLAAAIAARSTAPPSDPRAG